MERREVILILNSVFGVTIGLLERLEAQYAPLARIANASFEELERLIGKGTIARGIREALDTFDLAEEMTVLKRRGIEITLFDEKEYSENLKMIATPPLVLYRKGRLIPEDSDAIAIVGSRRATPYGMTVAERLGRELAVQGITVVSGLARGIDGRAHEGALRGGGRTIAVLGSGLANLYPSEHARLAERIAETGAVVSEFPLTMPPLPQNFPRRNRIVSGLSLGVVVVEAAARSGALITADFALEQGREVFAVPGRVDSATSEGTLELIKQGARPVGSAAELLEDMAGSLSHRRSRVERGGTEDLPALSSSERSVYRLLTEEAVHIDRITEELSLPSGRVSEILFHLVLKRVVRELPGNHYTKVG